MFFVDKWVHSNSLINVQPEENCRIDELLCCSDVEVLVCKAIWKISSVGGRKMTNERRKTNDKRRTTKDERRTNELIGSNFCLIGPNSERLVRIRTIGPSPNDWSEFWTNDEFDVAIGWTCWRSEICQSVKCPKKNLAWTDLDQVDFEKISSKSQWIENSAWTGLDKVKKGLFSGKCL
jgi:hypothetical protein